MCGIAGYVAARGLHPDESLLRRMCGFLVHRGPDGEGYFVDETAALGHRRLSIIDVEGGHQPLANEDGRLQIVFNGEIYNYRELMADLKKRGHQFRTRSDTEVLVHLFEEVGERLPEYLNGMFAFAIWDRASRSLFLARDRFGEKPLYFTTAIPGMAICFASELKAMRFLEGFPSKVRQESVADFLNFSYIADPETIYEDVRKLEPSHCMTVSGEGGLRDRLYWSPRFSPEGEAGSDQAASRLDALARDSVLSRMESDVPLGAFLSGGVDSSAVVAYMAQQAPSRVKTFSIGFTTEKYDELKYARMVVGRYRTDHHEKVVTPSIEEIFNTLLRHYDEPFGDSSAIPTLYLARMTREHVTVALSGDGADEVFGGYRRYSFALAEDRIRRITPAWFRAGVVGPAGRLYPKFDYLPRVFRAKATLLGIAASLPEAYFNAMSRFRDKGLEEILSPELRSSIRGFSCREKYCARFLPYRHLPPLSQLQVVDWKTYLPGDILVKVDRATMAYSLESRAPWLDHRLAELACTLPTQLKVHHGNGKVLFKQAVSPHLPPAMITRGKMGFSVPLPEWFRTNLRPVFEENVLRPGMAEYLNLSGVRRMWESHQSGARDHSAALWNLLMLACWQQHHNASSC